LRFEAYFRNSSDIWVMMTVNVKGREILGARLVRDREHESCNKFLWRDGKIHFLSERNYHEKKEGM